MYLYTLLTFFVAASALDVPELRHMDEGGCTTSIAGPSSTATVRAPLEMTGIASGLPVDTRTELRILPVRDGITAGYEATSGLNGYHLELQHDIPGMRNSVDLVCTY